MNKETYIAPIASVLLVASLLSTVALAADLEEDAITQESMRLTAIVTKNVYDYMALIPTGTGDLVDIYDVDENTVFFPDDAEPDATEPAPEDAEPDATEPAPEDTDPDATEPTTENEPSTDGTAEEAPNFEQEKE